MKESVVNATFYSGVFMILLGYSFLGFLFGDSSLESN